MTTSPGAEPARFSPATAAIIFVIVVLLGGFFVWFDSDDPNTDQLATASDAAVDARQADDEQEQRFLPDVGGLASVETDDASNATGLDEDDAERADLANGFDSAAGSGEDVVEAPNGDADTAVTTANPNGTVASEPAPGSTAGATGSPATSNPPPSSAPTATQETAAPAPPPSTAAPASESQPAGAVRGAALFVDPQNNAALWAANNASDGRADVIATRIGNQPTAKWFGEWSGNITNATSNYVNTARASNEIPVLVAFNIPDRDCGQHSAGGAPSFAAYDTWITNFANGLGDGPAIIILEPDSIALNGCAGSGRNAALSSAVTTISSSCSECRVYLDAGHSDWVAPNDMANRLREAGIANADGFFTNVSNFNATANETAFGQAVLNGLGNPPGVGQVIDVSRNGNGSNGEWCDPTGRALGADPTLDTGNSVVHGHLWIKAPGEADGCAGSAGQFIPDVAYALATN